MFYHLSLNKQTGRMYCRASGVWDVALARRFSADMQDLRNWAAKTDIPLHILSDLTGLPIHSQEVAPIVGEGANLIRHVRVERYAMIVPSALMRMQVRRIDPFPQRRFFDDARSAAQWLGWQDFVPVDAGPVASAA